MLRGIDLRSLFFLFLLFTILIAACGTLEQEESKEAPKDTEGMVVDLSADEYDNWMPKKSPHTEDQEYMNKVNVLIETLAKEVDSSDLFVRLIKSICWRESTWRHYFEVEEKYYVLLGDEGHSFGMMQIHDKYHEQYPELVANLKYGIKFAYSLYQKALEKDCEQTKKQGNSDLSLVRRTYAMYNGGPKAMCREGDSRDEKIAEHYEKEPWEAFL